MKRKILSLLLVFISVFTIFTFTFTPRVNATTMGLKIVPMPVYADTRLTAMEVGQLKEAIAAFNSTRFGTLFVYKGTKTQVQIYSTPNILGVTKAAFSTNNPKYVDTLANCILPEDGYVDKAIITINSNFNFTNSPSADGNGTYYLKSVLMHELFHAAGYRDHSIFSNSLVYEYYNGATNFLASDIEILDRYY